jgi:hypothetical protein
MFGVKTASCHSSVTSVASVVNKLLKIITTENTECHREGIFV